MTDAKKIFEELMGYAGVHVNGKDPWDIQVYNDRFYARVLVEHDIGLGEAYLDGWWDCERMDEFFNRVIAARIDQKLKFRWILPLIILHDKILNLQTRNRSRQSVGHFDSGNDVFENILDKRMIYTCGYWQDTEDLDEAQEKKLDLICRKIQLQPGMKVLDVGCGWGGFAKYAAEKYNAHVTGVNISREQLKYGRESCKGLPVTLEELDYRDIKGKYDRAVAIGVLEHVGHKNYRAFMEVVNKSLNDGGLFLLHTIGANETVNYIYGFLSKHIYPNAQIPSVKQIAEAAEGVFVMEDLHNFGTYYDKTCMAWYENLNRNWDKIKKLSDGHDERFYKLWKIYLLLSAGAFRARYRQLWQFVFSKNGVPGGYRSIR